MKWITLLPLGMLLTACAAAVTPDTAGSTSPPIPATPTTTALPIPLEPVVIDQLQMTDGTSGWAIGRIETGQASRILRTQDGGVTWRDISPGPGPSYGLFASDAQLAWVSLPPTDELWRTQDGGESWVSLGEMQASEVWFHDREHGWKMDAEVWGLSYVQFDILSFATTQDGGQTWQPADIPPGSGLAILAFVDPQTAWAIRAGFAKTIEGFPDLAVPFSLATTADGGKTWRSQAMPLPDGVGAIEMIDGASYLDAGNCRFVSPLYSSPSLWKMALTCEEQGWLYTSADQGSAWTIDPLPAGQILDVEFGDAATGWSLRRDDIDPYKSDLYRTTDSGATWTLLTRLNWADARLHFVDERAGWALATTCDALDCNPYLHPRVLARTTDGGRTWQSLQPQLLP